MIPRPPRPPLFPYTTLFRSEIEQEITDGKCGKYLLGIRGDVALRNEVARERQGDALIAADGKGGDGRDRKSTRLNSSHPSISYAVFCLKKKSESRLALSRTG